MVIRSSERSDSGIYRMTITVGDQVVEHDFDVAVIDYPRPGSRIISRDHNTFQTSCRTLEFKLGILIRLNSVLFCQFVKICFWHVLLKNFYFYNTSRRNVHPVHEQEHHLESS